MANIYIGAWDWSTIGMSEDTWEGRMAIKAAARRGAAEAEALANEITEDRPEPPPPPYGVAIG